MWKDKPFSELKQRIGKLSDQQLLNIVEKHSADYRKEALDYAKAELAARGIDFNDPSTKAQSELNLSVERAMTYASRSREPRSSRVRKDISLILLIAFSSFLGALAALCIVGLPLLLYILAVMMAGPSESFPVYMLFIIWFVITGALGVVFSRSLVGLGLITIRKGAVTFAVASIVGCAFIGVSSSDDLFQRVLIASLVSYVIGVVLCWWQAPSYDKIIEQDTLTTLSLHDKK